MKPEKGKGCMASSWRNGLLVHLGSKHAVRMLVFALLLALSPAPSAFAASYQQIDGTIVDPILYLPEFGGAHPCVGPNLEPGAYLASANLEYAHLFYADLTNADLTAANLGGARLHYASLDGADLSGAVLERRGAVLHDPGKR
jgi:hypothetical protein